MDNLKSFTLDELREATELLRCNTIRAIIVDAYGDELPECGLRDAAEYWVTRGIERSNRNNSYKRGVHGAICLANKVAGMLDSLGKVRKFLDAMESEAEKRRWSDKSEDFLLDLITTSAVCETKINFTTPPPAGSSTRWMVLARDGFRCVICGQSASDGAVLEVDHINPRSKGGDNRIDNLQTLCRKCNRGKGAEKV